MRYHISRSDPHRTVRRTSSSAAANDDAAGRMHHQQFRCSRRKRTKERVCLHRKEATAVYLRRRRRIVVASSRSPDRPDTDVRCFFPNLKLSAIRSSRSFVTHGRIGIFYAFEVDVRRFVVGGQWNAGVGHTICNKQFVCLLCVLLCVLLCIVHHLSSSSTSSSG